MSHALLLRLFLSPYFSTSVALHYLKTYPDNIGISHYLCWRMKSMPYEEVEFYWPQICHLLITRPTESNALESFVLLRAEESPHAAMLTFWFMQSALRDLTPTRTTNPRPFLICQRVLHRCHEILFGDPPEPSRSPYRSLPSSPNLSSSAALLQAHPADSTSPPVRVNPHAAAALVGMGVMLAGAGMPGLTSLAGEWAVIQGRRPMDDAQASRARVEVEQGGGADAPRDGRWERKPAPESESDDDNSTAPASASSSRPPARRQTLPPQLRTSGVGTPPRERERGHTPPNGRAYHPSATSPALVKHTAHDSLPAMPSLMDDNRGRDPFSQSSATPDLFPPTKSRVNLIPLHQAYHSVPELSRSSPTPRGYGARTPSGESLLQQYSLDAQSKLLRSHYSRSEIRFLLHLEDISNRLLVIPKPARISALRAELTSLNHNLPAEVCMPLWCNADHCRKDTAMLNRVVGGPRRKKAHSRVVRISPGDSVVLNSAERAPYLLHVEILEDDLDFDPTRRENRELLKKIVMQEDMNRRKREGALDGSFTPTINESFATSPMSVPPLQSDDMELNEEDEKSGSASPVKEPPEADLEEMDLVEQLYGNKLSVRDNLPDLTDALPLPSAPKNKQLDLEVWNAGEGFGSRRSSLGASPISRSRTPIGGDGELEVPSPTLRPGTPGEVDDPQPSPKRVITLEDYAERMRTAAVMLAQLNASVQPPTPENAHGSGPLRWIPGTGWITGASKDAAADSAAGASGAGGKLRLAAAQAAAIRERIMEEMMALEEERVARMTTLPEGVEVTPARVLVEGKTAEDEGIVRREINKADPSAAIFKESWTAKKSRIRAASPWGHLANWDVISVIVKTGADLRQEQLATQLIERFVRIWKEEKSDCWARFFRILITGETSGLVETITDAVSVHSIKKSEYARRLAEGEAIGHVSLMDHYVNTYGKPDSGQFARARRNFIKSLAGYSVITYLLQIKDRHNGNILVDRDGHLIHIDFGFMLSNSPGGNMGFEAAPFKLPLEYIEIMGGLDSPGYAYFKKLFKEGFEAARKHSDSLITIVELMQKDSKLDCFLLFGEHTVTHFRERFALGLTTAAVDAYLERLIVSSAGSNYTRLYDTFQYYSQGVL
ncbi:kinase-like protein [Cutaneotrichosporon oleaginosum]|uniref:1-phosphatidylinositol 4-kinase n=1 Tax=Cutaneotrichosporon oleaginosum TaxID=879819 RepID=A0A0J0XM92_9TREE|nr:kinase-like protein [Cutaneotrichosporon oleaginosum]KLT42183.1 kinase-like protein [Cutaneotrichosporon oleaginosum]